MNFIRIIWASLYIKREQEGKEDFFSVFGTTLIQIKWGQTDIQTDFYLKLLCLSSAGADGATSVTSTEVSGDIFFPFI